MTFTVPKAVAVLLFLALCALGFATCGSHLPPLQDFDLEGDPEVISRFAGRWYDYDGVLILRIVCYPSPALVLRLPEDHRLSRVRTQGKEIFFTLHYPDATIELSLRLLDEDVLVALPPGGSPSWCGTCTPRYVRLGLHRLLLLKAEGLWRGAWWGAQDAFERTVDWVVYRL